jgi:hypothetical protein
MLIKHIRLIIRLNVYGHLIINYSKIKTGKVSMFNRYSISVFVLRKRKFDDIEILIFYFSVFALMLSNDENYLMAVTFKGFKIFSFRSYLWKTCLLPAGVRNIMSGTKRLTYTSAFSHDNRFVLYSFLKMIDFYLLVIASLVLNQLFLYLKSNGEDY